MNRVKKQFFIYPAMMTLAMYSTVLGYMIPEIRTAFSLSLAQVGFFSTLQSIGMGVSLILCFCVFSAFNAIKVSSISMLVFAVLMVMLGINEYLVLLYLIFFLIGFFLNTTDTLSNTVIKETSSKNASFYLSLLHALWALAGVVGPFLAIALGGQYAVTFVWLGVIMAFAAALYIFGLRTHIRMPLVQNKHNIGGLGKLIKLIRKKGMISLVVINFFSCFALNVYIFFMVSYIKSLFNNMLAGAIMLSSLFLGMLVGRVIFSLVANKIPILKTLAISNALSIFAFVCMLYSQSLVFAAIFAALGFMFVSANFPALVLEAHKLVPKDVSAASALIYIGLFLALFIAPPLIGAIGDSIGLKLALLINAATLMPAVVLSAMLVKRFDFVK